MHDLHSLLRFHCFIKNSWLSTNIYREMIGGSPGVPGNVKSPTYDELIERFALPSSEETTSEEDSVMETVIKAKDTTKANHSDEVEVLENYIDPDKTVQERVIFLLFPRPEQGGQTKDLPVRRESLQPIRLEPEFDFEYDSIEYEKAWNERVESREV